MDYDEPRINDYLRALLPGILGTIGIFLIFTYGQAIPSVLAYFLLLACVIGILYTTLLLFFFLMQYDEDEE